MDVHVKGDEVIAMMSKEEANFIADILKDAVSVYEDGIKFGTSEREKKEAVDLCEKVNGIAVKLMI
jgi:hypothetical protein